jgi:hypothetical protein
MRRSEPVTFQQPFDWLASFHQHLVRSFPIGVRGAINAQHTCASMHVAFLHGSMFVHVSQATCMCAFCVCKKKQHMCDVVASVLLCPNTYGLIKMLSIASTEQPNVCVCMHVYIMSRWLCIYVYVVFADVCACMCACFNPFPSRHCSTLRKAIPTLR